MTPESIVAIATGTTGLTAFLIYAVRLLYLSHDAQTKSLIEDLRRQRDVALKGWADQTAATERLTDVLEKQARRPKT